MISKCWRILQNIPRSRFGSGWLAKFNRFFLARRYIRCKIFT